MTHSAYTTADAYRLASLASVDWRTARRALAGEHINGLAGERLRVALRTFQAEQSTSTQPSPLALSQVSKPTL